MINNLRYLNALTEGNSKEVKLLYQKNFPNVKKFILQNKGSIEDAEDIFQKALLQITVRYRKEKFVIKSSFEAYLYTVCKNLWRRELNKSKNKVTKEYLLEQGDESSDMALAVLEQKRWELFNESLSLISENCKKVLKMFFSKTPYSVIVEAMGYNSEVVARQRVFKCKRKLRAIIIEDSRYNLLKEL